MSKKSRRARAKVRGSGQNIQPAVVAQGQVNPQVKGQSVPMQPARAGAAAISPHQYDYVVSDLIHIGIIAGALILILIVLTFVMR